MFSLFCFVFCVCMMVWFWCSVYLCFGVVCLRIYCCILFGWLNWGSDVWIVFIRCWYLVILLVDETFVVWLFMDGYWLLVLVTVAFGGFWWTGLNVLICWLFMLIRFKDLMFLMFGIIVCIDGLCLFWFYWLNIDAYWLCLILIVVGVWIMVVCCLFCLLVLVG